MEIILNNDMTLAEIQAIFHEQFPHLKLEFYTQSHSKMEGTSEQYKIKNVQQKLSEIRSTDTEGHLSINGNCKVKTLEENFERQYGLFVQIFRLSGKLWLQTTRSDDWTLGQQERKGVQNDEPAHGESLNINTIDME